MIDRRVPSTALDAPADKLPFVELVRESDSFFYYYAHVGDFGVEAGQVVIWHEISGRCREFVYMSGNASIREVMPEEFVKIPEKIGCLITKTGEWWRENRQKIEEAQQAWWQENGERVKKAHEEMLAQREPELIIDREVSRTKLERVFAKAQEAGLLTQKNDSNIVTIDGHGCRVFVRTPNGATNDFNVADVHAVEGVDQFAKFAWHELKRLKKPWWRLW